MQAGNASTAGLCLVGLRARVLPWHVHQGYMPHVKIQRIREGWNRSRSRSSSRSRSRSRSSSLNRSRSLDRGRGRSRNCCSSRSLETLHDAAHFIALCV